MPAPLQVGCQVKAKVGSFVEHAKPDGAKAKRRQKSFMRGRIVAAKGPSMFSVHFDINGRTEDMRSNTLVFVSDPQFAAPPASIPPEGQVPFVLLPSTPPPAAASTLAVPPALEETIQNENEVAQTLARMPALLDPGDDDDNGNGEHGSNEEEGNDNLPPDDHHHFLLAADHNEEDEHQEDIVKNGDGDDVLILENNDEHVSSASCMKKKEKVDC
jgi:hypothetical protein